MNSTTQVQFVETGTYPTRAGNLVNPLVDGLPAFRRICEAIDSAKQNVWATITFMWPDFGMPDDRGTALDVLQAAAERGLEIRLIFWRPEEFMASHRQNAFWGSSDHQELLRLKYPDVNIRWDKALVGYAQHQKTWLVDAGAPGSTSFVGGINLNPHSLVPPGHSPSSGISGIQNHDVYLELQGPSVADVHHNFVQRWNESSERAQENGLFGKRAREGLQFPSEAPEPSGHSHVQIQRTMGEGLYTDETTPVSGKSFDIAKGERTNLDQYLDAINLAQRSIYIENQYLEELSIVKALKGALSRGVEVLVVLPVSPDYGSGSLPPERQEFLSLRAEMGNQDKFMLCGLAADDGGGGRVPIYVHSKVMVVDGQFATVGSTNLHHFSLFGNGELNVAIDDADAALRILAELFREHTALDISGCDDIQSIQQFKTVAKANTRKLNASQFDWQGIAFCMEISRYGEVNPLS